MTRYRHRDIRERARQAGRLKSPAKAKRALLRLRTAELALRELWLSVKDELGPMDPRTGIAYDVWYVIDMQERALAEIVRGLNR